MKKTLAALALAGSIVLVGSVPAMAANYPPLPPQAGVSDGTPAPGQQFTFIAQGFLPGETVTITITLVTTGVTTTGGAAVSAKIPVFQAPQTLSATADAQGKIAVPLTINQAGTYSLMAKGNTSGVVVGPVIINVRAALSSASTSNSGGLATTGVDSSLILWTLVGAGTLAAGATSVIVVRRRVKNEVTA